MATVRIILDPRTKKDGTASVMLSFNDGHYRKKINIGVSVIRAHWCNGEVSPEHAHYQIINNKIIYTKIVADGIMLRHLNEDIDGETIFAEIESALFPDRRQHIKQDDNKLIAVAKRLSAMKKESTRLTYDRTIKHLKSYIERGANDEFDKINLTWLNGFDVYLSENCKSANGRALHFRNLRAIANFAIDEGITNNYPFRRYKIKTIKTAHRSLSIDDLRAVLFCDVEKWQEIYRDMFALSFYLIGINFADMLHLKREDEHNGRIEFNRAKTARLYSMKIEPEAQSIIDKYQGKTYLLNIMESRTDYLQFIRQTNKALRKIGICERHGLGGKKTIHAVCSKLSTYWARHTWATIASSLDIPKETIAAALGHGCNKVTDIYIDYDLRKVDSANRRVIDYVLRKKERE